MGINEAEALTLARKIAIFNGEVTYYVKNELMLGSPELTKKHAQDREKLFIIIRTNYPKVNVDLILSNSENNKNHNLTKLDVSLIYDMLLEIPEGSETPVLEIPEGSESSKSSQLKVSKKGDKN
jgi:hypothetical protein